MHRNFLHMSEGRRTKKRDHRPQVPGSQVIKVQCKVEISLKYHFLLCFFSILVSYLVLWCNLLQEERLMTSVRLRSLAKPTNDLPILFTEELEFLSMVSTEVSLLLFLLVPLNLLEPLHYIGHLPVRPQVPRLKTNSAYRAASAPLLANYGLLVVYSDTGLAEGVTTVKAQGFCQKLQANRAGHLLLYVHQDS